MRPAIEQQAERHGWVRIVGDTDGEIWARGGERIVVYYRMFGTLRNGVGLGIELAIHGDEVLTGKNKKGQVLRLLATPPQGETK